MSNTNKSRPEVVLATWATRVDIFGQGERATYGMDGTCDSFWLSLRYRDRADSSSWLGRESEAVNDIGLYVWLNAPDYGDRATSWSVDIKLHGVHSADLGEAELRLKHLRRLTKRMPARFSDEPFHLYLPRMFAALGVSHAVRYNGIGQDDTYTAIGAVLPRLCGTFAERLEECVRARDRKLARAAA